MTGTLAPARLVLRDVAGVRILAPCPPGVDPDFDDLDQLLDDDDAIEALFGRLPPAKPTPAEPLP